MEVVRRGEGERENRRVRGSEESVGAQDKEEERWGKGGKERRRDIITLKGSRD